MAARFMWIARIIPRPLGLMVAHPLIVRRGYVVVVPAARHHHHRLVALRVVAVVRQVEGMDRSVMVGAVTAVDRRQTAGCHDGASSSRCSISG